MPESFMRCVRKYPKNVRTISGPNKQYGVPAGKYRRICFEPSGKTHRGELHTKESKSQAKENALKRLKR